VIMKLVLSSAASAALLDAVIDERGTQVGRYLDAVKPLVLSKSGAAAALTTDIAAGIVRLLDPDAAELLAESTTLQLSGADSSARSADTSERSPGSNGRRPRLQLPQLPTRSPLRRGRLFELCTVGQAASTTRVTSRLGCLTFALLCARTPASRILWSCAVSST
jgi:hypothetical protein